MIDRDRADLEYEPVPPPRRVSEDGHTCLDCREDVTECRCDEREDYPFPGVALR